LAKGYEVHGLLRRSSSFNTERLVERGVPRSVTAMSIAGAFGGKVQTFSFHLLASGLVHNTSGAPALRRASGRKRVQD